jgi:hypothetical protein
VKAFDAYADALLARYGVPGGGRIQAVLDRLTRIHDSFRRAFAPAPLIHAI